MQGFAEQVDEIKDTEIRPGSGLAGPIVAEFLEAVVTGKETDLIIGLRHPDIGLQRFAVAAKLRREAGQSVEEVSRFLDHSSLAVTSVYLRQLEGDRDTTWQQVAESIGV